MLLYARKTLLFYSYIAGPHRHGRLPPMYDIAQHLYSAVVVGFREGDSIWIHKICQAQSESEHHNTCVYTYVVQSVELQKTLSVALGEAVDLEFSAPRSLALKGGCIHPTSTVLPTPVYVPILHLLKGLIHIYVRMSCS